MQKFCVAMTILLLYTSLSAGDDAMRWSGSAADYERSRDLRRLTQNKVFKTQVRPNWFAENSRFWYRNDLAEGCREFVLVDALKGTRVPAFDHARLAAALSKAGIPNVSPERLPIDTLSFQSDTRLILRTGGKTFACELTTYEVAPHTAALAPEKTLPASTRVRPSKSGGGETSVQFVNRADKEIQLFWIDLEGQRRAYAAVKPGENHDQHTYSGHVWLAADRDGKTLCVFEAAEAPSAAIIDGKEPKPDARVENPARPERERGSSPDGKWAASIRENNLWIRNAASGESSALTTDGVAGDGYGRFFWSPDSQRLMALKTRAAQEHKVYVVESSPKDQLQPKLHTFDYLKPGDRVAVEKLHLFDVVARKELTISDKLFENPWDLNDFRWEPDSRRFTFVFNQRGHQALRLLAIDAQTGAVEAIVNEESKTFICYSSKTFVHYLDTTHELIWMSERDGWNHLYLYDTVKREVKNQITRGEWVVRSVDRVDVRNRQIYFQAGGIHPNQDPYYLHYCRINFDGTGLVKLTEGNGTHSITYSPDERFFIDSYSRVDLPPVTELRHAESGKLVCTLEQGDASTLLKTGWQAPEPFVAKGRDGTSDIHGVILRPINFDPKHKYPVIEHIYAGPHDSHVPKRWSSVYGMQELAELGFILVQIDGMGTSNRSKAFHDVCWKNIADAGFPDRVLWMKAAAARYPCMDLSRGVGIYGGSAGGQNALGALLFHGEFYKVAAADCGCHDNRMDKIWWNEQWMGWPVGKHYEEQSNVTHAHKLQGKLLLTVGELDKNVDPASTLQVASALTRANKDYDLIVIPGGGHGSGESPYASRRRKDFFVRHLLGVEPRR